MRFRPEQHLRRQSEIRAVREQGRRIDCRAFTLWWRHRPDGSTPALRATPRVCVIASTAAVGKAVARNRAKRRLREVFRQQQDRVPSTCDLLLIARAAAGTCAMTELQQRFTDACSKIPAPPLSPSAA